MTPTSRFLLRLARWFAGRDRTEWLDAMTAESEAAGRNSTSWALGCAWASLKDRTIREGRFLRAILFLPLAVYLLEFVIFFPVVWLSRQAGLPAWTFIVAFLLLPLPFSFALGRSTSLQRALAGAALSSVALDMIGVAVFWLEFGMGPHIWFEKGSQVYNMPPMLGWACSLSVWLTGAWLGSRWRTRRIV